MHLTCQGGGMKFRIVQSTYHFLAFVLWYMIFGCIPTYGKANIMSSDFAVDARGLWIHAVDFNS